MDFLEHEILEVLNIFREESEEQLQNLNKNLLELEANPKNYKAIVELFREAHSLKGAAKMIGLDDIQSIAHKLEDVFGLAKEGLLRVSPEVIDVMCKAVDCMGSIVDESIRTRGKAETPELQNVIAALEVVKSQEIISEEESDIIDISSSVDNKKLNDVYSLEKQSEIKKLLTQVNVNIEKLRVFSTSTDTIEEFSFFIDQLSEKIEFIDNGRITGLIDDIKVKLKSAIKGSGILIDDEVQEIESIFNDFMMLYDRYIYNFQSNAESENTNDVDEKPEQASKVEIENLADIKKDEPSGEPTIEDTEVVLSEVEQKIQSGRPELNNTSVINRNVEELDSDDIQEKLDEAVMDEVAFENSSEVEFVKDNLLLFSNHSEENAAKFEEIIIKLNSLTATTNEDNIRQIIEKLADILVLSKDNGTPINKGMINILCESFNSIALMLDPRSENKEDPLLILQRITVLSQMLKRTISEDRAEINDEDHIKQADNSVKDMPAAKKNDNFPVEYSTDIVQKNINKNGLPPSGTKDTKPGESNTIKTLRVDTHKLDQLVNQAGELIIAKIKAKEHLTDIEKMIRFIEDWHKEWAKTKQYFKYTSKSYNSSDKNGNYSTAKNLNTFLEENSSRLLSLITKINSFYKVVQEDDARMNLIVSGLEEKIKSVRVLHLATIFHMFPRMVRDIARDRGKEIEFFISGSETSVDKKIIEEIKSPLTHILRNSIDHGIEPPVERLQKGKPQTGKILLAAHHLENSVLIEITDDGKGIDVDAIKKKVLQKELLTPEELEAMSEEQIMNIIFWPGFSTGETVTNISGRGIGLDIVYTKINQLNGTIKVKSTLGQGCQVSIQIPVTMATINSFLVNVNSQTYAIPTSAIKTTLLIDKEQIFYKEGRKSILFDGKTVPICSMAEMLEQPEYENKSGKLIVIILQAEDIPVGFVVDKLIGDHEILHKNLSAPLIRVKNIAGITTLGSGDLCLILNINDLIKSAYLRFGEKLSKPQITQKVQPENTVKNALIVDDSATTRILQRNILKSAGYNVEVAVNGFDALTKVASNKYDIIITDVEMPEMDGFELTERLRREERYKDIPIIMVTSLAAEEHRKKGLDLGVNSYMTKGSFDQGEFLDTVKSLSR